jgi:hypothetical protein
MSNQECFSPAALCVEVDAYPRYGAPQRVAAGFLCVLSAVSTLISPDAHWSIPAPPHVGHDRISGRHMRMIVSHAPLQQDSGALGCSRGSRQ